MEWSNRFLRLLEETFKIEHLSSPDGKSYGAGSPVSAGDLLQSCLPGEDIEHYPEILVDEWAAQHVIDQEVGFETLLEFDFEASTDTSELVQFVLLDNEFGRSFLGRKLPGQTLHFLAAIDSAARSQLLSATILALLAAEAAFGETPKETLIPSAIVNQRPDLVSEAVLQKGIGLMFDHATSRSQTPWRELAVRFGRPPDGDHQDILSDYFKLVYTESERW